LTDTDQPWQVAADHILLAVRLIPNAGRDRIDGAARLADGAPVLKARVAAVPEKGAANRALVRLIARALDLPASAVTVVSGDTQRLKRLRIAATGAPLLERLRALARFDADSDPGGRRRRSG
jgi:hypothetical protein